MKYTKNEINKIVHDEDVRFIRLQFTDIFGSMKNVSITPSQLEKALDNKIRFDGSSIDGFVRIEESDMALYPDLDSFAIHPWGQERGKVARLTGTTERLHFHISLSCIGEGNGNPLQCSCLENPRDSRAWCRLWGRIESDMTEAT